MTFPYLFHTEKHKSVHSDAERHTLGRTLREAGHDTLRTLKEIISDRNGLLFTIVWFLASDAASAGQTFMALMLQGAAGVSSTKTDYIILTAYNHLYSTFLLIIFSVPFSIIGGLVSGFPLRKWGARVSLYITICSYLCSEGFFIMAIYSLGTVPVAY